jgi:hypothetical protein
MTATVRASEHCSSSRVSQRIPFSGNDQSIQGYSP